MRYETLPSALSIEQKSGKSGLPSSHHHPKARYLLIMDDEERIREVVGMFLRAMGYAVLEAKIGETNVPEH